MLLAACGAPKEPPPPDAGHWWDATLGGCLDQSGPAPRTIGQVVERINGLPRPVSVACLVASLPRPLSVVAVASVTSAQPADGRRSPRVFLFTDQLVLSVVPAGIGKDLLEFGEIVAPGRTLKAELPFPVTAALPQSAPYTHVLSGPYQTNCALCHRAEVAHPTVDAGFVSAAFRPNPGELVPLSELQAEVAPCDPATERARCELLTALFAFGATAQGKFPAAFELFIQ